MNITFYGAAGCVTGSNYLIETDKYNFVVDCGMFQGSKTLKENNYGEFPYDPEKISFVLLTHAHIDHTGLLPKLVKHGFNGPVYSTAPTLELLEYLLADSAYIQKFEVQYKNRRNERKGLPLIEPIYDELDAEAAISMFKNIERHETFEPAPGCRVTFYNAGHVLGSSFIDIELEENGEKRRLIFSGDLGRKDQPIVDDPDHFESADYLMIESTYGDRLREGEAKVERLAELKDILQDGMRRGGKILIPAFALERTQDLLHDILTLKSQGHLDGLKVVVDSPLATKITKVFMKYTANYDEDAVAVQKKMGGLFDHPDFSFTSSVDESKALNDKKGIVVLSASGMCDAGRIKHHLKNGLWDSSNTVVFVGYQANGTLGRFILEGQDRVRIHGEEIDIKANIKRITGYSAHADQKGLLDWLKDVKEIRRKVFVVHGETDSASAFVDLLKKEYNFEATAPIIGDTFDLVNGTDLERAADFDEIKIAEKAYASDVVKKVSTEKEDKAPTSDSAGKTALRKPRIAPPKDMDAHNLYADLSLKLAELMRSNKSQKAKHDVLADMLKIIK